MIKIIITLIKSLNKSQKYKILTISIISFFIPFLEVLSIASLGALILFIIDIDNNIKLIPLEELRGFIQTIDKMTLVFALSIIFSILIILKNLFLLLYAFLEAKIKKEISSSYAINLYKHYLNKKYINLAYLDTSEIQNQILWQSGKVSLYIFLIITLIKDFFLALLFITGLFIINFKVTFLLIFLSLVLSTLYSLTTRKKISKLGLLVSILDGELIKITQNTLVGIKTIIIYSKKKFFHNKFIEIIGKKIKNEIWFTTISVLPRLILECIFALCIVLFLILSINSEEDIANVLPYLVFLSLVSIRMLPIFSSLNIIIANIRLVKPIVSSLLKFWDVSKIPAELPFSDLVKENFDSLNCIELKNINFEYSTPHKKIIDDLSFKFEKNKIYALTGVSGGGKSTLIVIICGFLEPYSGQVEVNGKSIYLDIESWQGQVAFVPQDNFLLNDSIIKNVSFGELDNEINIKKFNNAIIQSNLIEFVDSLKKKEQTIVGDRGINISGGQRQRIGLARALYKNGNFIALDEATNSVDKDSEVEIMNTLHKIKKDKIIIVVAHRQSTINLCDEVIKMNNGTIKITKKI